jgi:hypothetical protein
MTYGLKFCRLFEFGILGAPVDTLQPSIDVGITPQQADVALESTMISNIEACRRGVCSNICLGELIPRKIFLF